MKLTSWISTIGLVTFAFGSAAWAQAPAPKVQPTPIKPPIKMPPNVCPDPAAQRIDFGILSKSSQFQGRVRVTGIVKNVGIGAYESSPTQQNMLLYEDTRVVANQPFHNLTPGQEVRVTYDRNWNASSPSEGEFPPTYKLLVVYDPDIKLDSNPKNDDCNGGNNRLERSGSGINDLFKADKSSSGLPVKPPKVPGSMYMTSLECEAVGGAIKTDRLGGCNTGLRCEGSRPDGGSYSVCITN